MRDGAAEPPEIVTLKRIQETVKVINEQRHKHTVETCRQTTADDSQVTRGGFVPWDQLPAWIDGSEVKTSTWRLSGGGLKRETVRSSVSCVVDCLGAAGGCTFGQSLPVVIAQLGRCCGSQYGQ